MQATGAIRIFFYPWAGFMPLASAQLINIMSHWSFSDKVGAFSWPENVNLFDVHNGFLELVVQEITI